jgi:mRNA-degrading endonuclease RelE of RelBE toxin-antitoxin system
MIVGGFDVVWDWQALHHFYRLPPHTATIVDRAVLRFVERGEGQIERVGPYTRLRAGFYDVVLVIDAEDRTVTVLRIYRAR